jgi:hypothetical protein
VNLSEIKMFLNELNDDELILIFKYCSELDHRNLAKVCKLFEAIIEAHFNELKCRNLLMVTHQKSHPEIFNRTFNGTMKYSERLRIHQNWIYGAFHQIVFLQHRENYVTHLELDSQHLYTASLGEFNVYKRRRKDIVVEPTVFTAGAKNDSVITSLKRKGELVAGSRANGSILTYSDYEGYNMEFVRDGNEPITDLDFHDEVFVTSTKSDLKFHRLGMELDLLTFDPMETELSVGFKTVNFNLSGDKILGTNAEKFFLLDSSNAAIIKKYSHTSQIYSSQWISDTSFLFTSWHNPLSLIDCRMDFKRQEFSCGNFTATSIDYDGRFGVVYGTLLGMIILCDLRNPHTFERVLHLDTPAVCRKIISDEFNLFVSTDNAMHLLNFY